MRVPPRRLPILGATILLLLLTTATAAGATTLTPRHAARLLLGDDAQATRSAVVDGSQTAAFVRLHSAVCHGLAGSHGRFRFFSCTVKWTRTDNDVPDQIFGRVIWFRPATTCLNGTGLAYCPPPAPKHPLPGDPRVCRHTALCMGSLASHLVLWKLDPAHGRPVIANFMCVPTRFFTFNCTWVTGADPVTVQHSAAVKFIRGRHRWRHTVTIS